MAELPGQAAGRAPAVVVTGGDWRPARWLGSFGSPAPA